MAGFKFTINVEPQDIPRLDDAHKRDCADALRNSVNSTLKYTLVMSGTIMALYAAYTFFSLTWYLRMYERLPEISGFVPLAAGLIFLFEFVSGTMKGWALAMQTFFHVVIIFAALTSKPSIIIVPFVIYGAMLHFKLITLLPWYKAISEQPGYPEFTPLPEKEDISPAKREEDTKKTEDPTEDEKAPAEEKQAEPEEKQAESEEKQTEPEEAVPENKPEEKQPTVPEDKSDAPDENKPVAEEKPQTANNSAGGSGSKKKKRHKKRKK